MTLRHRILLILFMVCTVVHVVRILCTFGQFLDAGESAARIVAGVAIFSASIAMARADWKRSRK